MGDYKFLLLSKSYIEHVCLMSDILLYQAKKLRIFKLIITIYTLKTHKKNTIVYYSNRDIILQRIHLCTDFL